MEANYKKYRKVPPYMTKTGLQIGLLHQEPFEARMDHDAYRLQEALLAQKYKPVKKEVLFIDGVIGFLSVILLISIVLGVIYGFI